MWFWTEWLWAFREYHQREWRFSSTVSFWRFSVFFTNCDLHLLWPCSCFCKTKFYGPLNKAVKAVDTDDTACGSASTLFLRHGLKLPSARVDNMRKQNFIFYIRVSVRRNYINKIQQDATVCMYLFTAKSLYMFRVSIAPIIMST